MAAMSWLRMSPWRRYHDDTIKAERHRSEDRDRDCARGHPDCDDDYWSHYQPGLRRFFRKPAWRPPLYLWTWWNWRRQPTAKPGMLAGKIAVIVRALAASAVPARRGIVAAIAEPEMEVVLEAPPLLEAKACLDGHLNLLRQFVQMQLEELSAAILVRACRPPGMAISLLAVETPDLGQRTKQGLRLSCRMVSGRPSSFPIIRYSPDIDRCCCCSRFSSSRSWLHFGPHAGLRVRSGSLRAARNGSASI
jgi:hypothetical protein